MITVTGNANLKVSELCQEHDCYAVTLDIKGGGCGGYEYDWKVAQKEEVSTEDYFTIQCDTGILAVHKDAQSYLAGTEIDYIKNVFNQHFELRNPNVASECGCGISINFDMDKVTAL
jgi:iron-sulfur cluster assembly protein